MAAARRVWTPAKRAKVIAYITQHGKTAAMAKYRLSGSMVYKWMKPSGAAALSAGDKLHEAGKPISHAALLYLRSAKRAGPTAKGHLLAMLALEELEGR